MFEGEMRKETSKVLDMSPPLLGCAEMELVGHARLQMKVRGIDTTDIIHTLRSPDETGLPTQPGRQRYRWKKTIRRAVDVVFELLQDRVRVITVIAVERRLVERKKKRNGNG
jgi:hypothetical protein